ncbi:DUF418 domain-containing protein [Bacillus sp. FJAT-29790]|uniref:DUF418 domain-containing protein n=1 Tax=Bacillus sp. FJAT-29790 TaxID=1895002 RepID=UPI001C229349|nr:DUF418 domain-containing protein [Bacillus sp. FJAT-29790]MBU8877394.1 DUF418 domain-containing protein [Bacillus sp. FJAT-29790]
MKSAPISIQERILTIDIIRGFALLGIFLVNMPAFHSPAFMVRNPEYTGMDYWLDLFLQMFVQTKFYTIFSFLFGLGFYIFMSRAEQKGLKINRLFTRRLTVLLLFGAVHFIFIWFGDILHTYALAGFFLFLFYKRKAKTILTWAFSLLFVFYSLISAQFLLPASTIKEIQAMDQDKESKIAEYIDMYEHASYLDWVSYRIHTEIIPLTIELPFVLITVLAMFLFGLYAGKIGIFQPNSPHLPKIKKIWLITLLLSIPLVILLAIMKLGLIDLGVYQENALFLFTSLSGLPLCFFYMSSLTLLLRKKLWQKLLRPLGFTGQMALTNYLSQTVISTFIFLGLHFFGKVSLVTGTLICLGIYIFQVLFSYIWLKSFRFGPLEWLWRSLTYGYFQAMKKQEGGKSGY